MHSRFLLLTAVWATAWGAAVAQDAPNGNAGFDAEMARMIAREVALEMQSQQLGQPVLLESAETLQDDSECNFQGWSASVEMTYLRAHWSRDPGASQIAPDTNRQPRYDYEAAPRIQLGYMAENGLGVRARYFHWEGKTERLSSVNSPTDFLQFESQMDFADLEMTFSGSKRDWCALTSVGARYARVDTHEIGQETGFGVSTTDQRLRFSGYGPTASLELQRKGVFGFTPFVNGRGSLLFGNRVEEDLVAGNSAEDEPSIYVYLETQMGLEWKRQTRFGEFFLRTALEAQYSPLMGTLAETSSDNEEDHMSLSLVGGTLGLGLRF